MLGIELVALALITGGGHLALDRRARDGPSPAANPAPDAAPRAVSDAASDAAPDPGARGASMQAVAALLDAVAPNALTSALLLIAGLLALADLQGGLDVLALPVLAALAGGVASAWLLLTKIAE